AAKDVDKFCERQLDQHHPEDEKNARVLRKSTRLIDPKHHQRNQEKEQRNDKILRWLGLVAAKDEHSQASNEGGEKDALHAPGISIWVTSPVTTHLEFMPMRVSNMNICSVVAFCASSRMTKALFRVRPRM